MDCPRCKSGLINKAGVVKSRQRYNCKVCGYYFTVTLKSTAKGPGIKRMALEMYLEGLGFNSIARLLKVSHVSIQKWINNYGQQIRELKSENEIHIVELHELYTYLITARQSLPRGILLIELGDDSSKSFWVLGDEKTVRGYGKKARVRHSGNTIKS